MDVTSRQVRAGDVEVPMQAVLIAFLAWLADCRRRGLKGASYRDSPEKFLGWYSRVLSDQGAISFEETKRSLHAGFTKEDFRSRTTTVNLALRKALGSVRAKDYEISLQQRGSSIYSLSLPASAITVRGEPDC